MDTATSSLVSTLRAVAQALAVPVEQLEEPEQEMGPWIPALLQAA